MKQPDDPGIPPADNQARSSKAWTILVIFLVVALIVVTIVGAWGHDSVPFAEDCNTEPADECQIYNQATVWVQTGTERTISFCERQDEVDSMALFYGLEGYGFPPKAVQVPFMTAEIPEGTNFEIWTPARAGAVYFRVRACRTDIEQDGEPIPDTGNPGEFHVPELRAGTSEEWVLCSTWNQSLDAQVSNGTCSSSSQFPRGFFVQVELAPATGGGIE